MQDYILTDVCLSALGLSLELIDVSRIHSEKYRHISMSFLPLISQIVIYTLMTALLLWGMKYAVSLFIFSRKKEEINKLNARISVLKLHLKGKVKRKCNKIEQIFKKEPPETLAELKPKLNSIAELQFNNSNDYQVLVSALVEITLAIIAHIKIKHKTLIRLQQYTNNQNEPDLEETGALTEQEEIEEKCRKLVKYDKGTMTVIIELVETTQQIITKIAEYNAFTEYDKSQKKITDIPTPIQIENYDLIFALVDLAKTTDLGGPEMQVLGKDFFDGDGDGDGSAIKEKL